MSTINGPSARGLRFQLARVTIETLAPLGIGTGGGDDLQDSICVTDANGLPAIPGSSLAGVLRASLAGANDPDLDPRCRDLFGFQQADTGASSRVEVSWAQVHGSDDRPVSFRGAPTSDPVLAFLATGVRRDHVRLNRRGVADLGGKFDETLVPRGARFTFEIRLHDGTRAELDELLGRLHATTVRLGGRVRRGCGSFSIVRALVGAFDLANPSDRQRWRALPVMLHEAVPEGVLLPAEIPALHADTHVGFALDLEAEDYWLFGGGEPARDSHVKQQRVVDALPMSEPILEWSGRAGQMSDLLTLVPATGIKGALRRRTAFHLRRLAGQLVVAGEPSLGQRAVEDPPEVVALFGDVKQGKQAGQEARSGGRPGRVFLSDLHLPPSATRDGSLDHVTLDRFTAGPIDGKLFSEAPLFGGKLRIEVDIDTRAGGEADEAGVPQRAREAFLFALGDLCAGRLALGAGDSRGHGFFRGRWEDTRGGIAWLEARA